MGGNLCEIEYSYIKETQAPVFDLSTLIFLNIKLKF